MTLKWRFKHYFSLSTSVGATVPMFRNNITKPASSMLWLSGQAFFIPVITHYIQYIVQGTNLLNTTEVCTLRVIITEILGT